MCLSILLAGVLVFASQTSALPIVDPGLFVISGVKTCGGGEGYCLLGSDCSLDKDFVGDRSGHCSGLRGAFTPSAHFVCCSDSKKENEVDQDISKPNPSNYPADVEADMMTTTENPETTTFEIVKDYILLDQDNQTENQDTQNKCESCNSTVKLAMGDSQLCLGSHVGKGWIVTSASCAMKVFRVGMVNVMGSYLDDPEFEASVKTIIVHESYRPSASNILLPETNNLGLLQMNDSMSSRCVPCLPKKGQSFAGQICNTLENTSEIPDLNSTCESEVETMQGEAKEEFLTLACDGPTDSRYFGGEIDSGKPLNCDGYITGVETSSGVGMTVFTQVSLYADWIKANMKPKPSQQFRTT